MSSYRGNAGRSNGATTWYLAEDVDQVPLGWRGPLHYVPLRGTEDKFELPLKRESIRKFTDGTSKTLLAGEQTNLFPARRSFWAHTFGNYILSQATDQRRIFMADYEECTKITGPGGSRPCMSAWYSNHNGSMNYVKCDGSGASLTFDIDLRVFGALASIAGEETFSLP